MKTSSYQNAYARILLLLFAVVAVVGGAALWICTGMPGPGILVTACTLLVGGVVCFVIGRMEIRLLPWYN